MISERLSIIKPSLQTPYHIDFEWWKTNEMNWKVMLLSYLSPEDQKKFENNHQDIIYDIIDPITAEITRVDALQHTLISDYAKREGFISETTSLVEAVFRVFLAVGNKPMNSVEIAERLGRPANLVLQMLSGKRIYQGIRPYMTKV